MAVVTENGHVNTVYTLKSMQFDTLLFSCISNIIIHYYNYFIMYVYVYIYIFICIYILFL